MHTAIQLANPDLSSRFCLDPDQSRNTRKQLIERCADSGIVMLPAHFPTPTAGCITRHDNGFRYSEHTTPNRRRENS